MAFPPPVITQKWKKEYLEMGGDPAYLEEYIKYRFANADPAGYFRYKYGYAPSEQKYQRDVQDYINKTGEYAPKEIEASPFPEKSYKNDKKTEGLFNLSAKLGYSGNKKPLEPGGFLLSYQGEPKEQTFRTAPLPNTYFYSLGQRPFQEEKPDLINPTTSGREFAGINKAQKTYSTRTQTSGSILTNELNESLNKKGLAIITSRKTGQPVVVKRTEKMLSDLSPIYNVVALSFLPLGKGEIIDVNALSVPVPKSVSNFISKLKYTYKPRFFPEKVSMAPPMEVITAQPSSGIKPITKPSGLYQFGLSKTAEAGYIKPVERIGYKPMNKLNVQYFTVTGMVKPKPVKPVYKPIKTNMQRLFSNMPGQFVTEPSSVSGVKIQPKTGGLVEIILPAGVKPKFNFPSLRLGSRGQVSYYPQIQVSKLKPQGYIFNQDTGISEMNARVIKAGSEISLNRLILPYYRPTAELKTTSVLKNIQVSVIKNIQPGLISNIFKEKTETLTVVSELPKQDSLIMPLTAVAQSTITLTKQKQILKEIPKQVQKTETSYKKPEKKNEETKIEIPKPSVDFGFKPTNYIYKNKSIKKDKKSRARGLYVTPLSDWLSKTRFEARTRKIGLHPAYTKKNVFKYQKMLGLGRVAFPVANLRGNRSKALNIRVF